LTSSPSGEYHENPMLDNEFTYYKDHQDELVERYNGKFIAIVGTEIKGAFDTELDAYLVMKKDHSVGTFLVQHCLPGTMSYTQTFHSRVVF
jgi:hypothetical protein